LKVLEVVIPVQVILTLQVEAVLVKQVPTTTMVLQALELQAETAYQILFQDLQ
jgi:hypothetical protein